MCLLVELLPHCIEVSGLKHDWLIKPSLPDTADISWTASFVNALQVFIILVLINAAVQKHAQRLKRASDVTDYVEVLIVVGRISEIPLTDGMKLMNQANKPAASQCPVRWHGRTNQHGEELPFSCW